MLGEFNTLPPGSQPRGAHGGAFAFLRAAGPGFGQELPADPAAFVRAIQPYRKDLVVGCECMFARY